MKNKSLKTNGLGYEDPTAFNAIVNADKIDDEKINEVLEKIFDVCKEHGVFIYGDLMFVERFTNKKARKKLYYKSYIFKREEKKNG